jgi:hypothetical protein
MSRDLSNIIDRLSEFFAQRKGLLPSVGIILIILNLIFQLIPLGWVSSSNMFLHVGIIVAILGFMLAWAL